MLGVATPGETLAGEGWSAFSFSLLCKSGLVDKKVFVPISLRKETCYWNYFIILSFAVRIV